MSVGTQIFGQYEQGEQPSVQQAQTQATPATLTSTIKPQLQFIVLDDDFSGTLLCWFSADRDSVELYEIWCREISKTNDFVRIALVPAVSARQDAANKYKKDIEETNIVQDINSVGAWKDFGIKKDVIYEYKIRGIIYPKAEDWSLASLSNVAQFVLDSNVLASISLASETNNTSPLDEISLRIFGDNSYGWVLGTLNSGIDYFASNVAIMGQLASIGTLFVPAEIVDFIAEVKKGISSYSICTIIEKIAKSLGKIDENVLQILINAVNENRMVPLENLALLRTNVAQNVLPIASSIALMSEEKKTPPPPPPVSEEKTRTEIIQTNVLDIKEIEKTKLSAVDATSPTGLSMIFSTIRSTMLSKSGAEISNTKVNVKTTNINIMKPEQKQETKENKTILNADLIKTEKPTKKIVRK